MMVRPVFRTIYFLPFVLLIGACTLVLPKGEEDIVAPSGDDLMLTPEPDSEGFVADTDYKILEDGEYRIEKFPAGQNFILLDNFDSHTWVDSGKPYFQRAELGDAGQIIAPIEPLAENNELAGNSVEIQLAHRLPIPEDWSQYAIATVDVFMEQHPSTSPEVRLCLENSEAKQACTRLLKNQQLAQWDNRQLIFLLKDNLPHDVLSDVRRVYLSLHQYDDVAVNGQVPYELLNFRIQNFQLDGATIWDRFDQVGLEWPTPEQEHTQAGVSHGRTLSDSAGALYLGWDHDDWGPSEFPSIRSGRVSLEMADWSQIKFLRGKVYALERGVPLEFNLYAGDEKLRTTTAVVEQDGEWVTVLWQLPQRQPNFDYENITSIEFVMPGTADFPAGEVWLDQLEIGRSTLFPSQVEVDLGRTANIIMWENPNDSEIERVFVWASREKYPSGPQEGIEVCSVVPLEEQGSCEHYDLRPGEQWYYTVASRNRYAYHFADGASQADGLRNIFLFSPPNAQFEVAFDRDNGRMLYLLDLKTGREMSQGSVDGDLWQLEFLGEGELTTLASSDFSAGSVTHDFSIDASQNRLIYQYDNGIESLELVVDLLALDPQSFDMRVTVDNQTGQAIRTVSAPHRLGFLKPNIEQLLLPIYEGLVLQPQFFAENRSAYLSRPPLFADLLAMETKAGDVALYRLQDGSYQAELIPHHDANQPVFQPSNLEVQSAGAYATVGFDLVTYIPPDGRWQSGTLRVRLNQSFRQLAVHYRTDNGFDDIPTLRQKLDPADQFDQMAQSPIWHINLYQTIERFQAQRGGAWEVIGEDWLNQLASPGLLYLTHWQTGRDFYSDPTQNHQLHHDLPEAMPIWWTRYGSEDEFLNMLQAADDADFLTMPFVNWTIWNKLDPATNELPLLEQMPMASRQLRGPNHPWIELDGYLVEPWDDAVQERNSALVETFSRNYPQDVLFADQLAQRGWRYTLLDDGTPSAGAYTQAILNESARLAEQKPMITSGLFDQLAGSVVGYAQSLQTGFADGSLLFLGDAYEHWVPYPFAADVVHGEVAFYPHHQAQAAWPTADPALFTYYTVFGYNLMGDAGAELGNHSAWSHTLSAFQQVVNSATFGQPLVDYSVLSDDGRIVQTRWEGGENDLLITASFQDERVWSVDGFSVAPNGFFARTENRDRLAGIFEGQFNGNDLTAGRHWITVFEQNGITEIQHPQGEDTLITISRPKIWTEDREIQVVRQLADGNYVLGEVAILGPETVTIHYENLVGTATVKKVLVYYGPSQFETVDESIYTESPTRLEEAPLPVVQLADLWRLTRQTADELVLDAVQITPLDGQFALEKIAEASSPSRFETESIPFDFDRPLIFSASVSEIPVGDRLVFQLQEQGGSFGTYDLLTANQAGVYQVDVGELTGWADSRTFKIVVWLSAGSDPILLNTMSLQVEQQTASAEAVDPADQGESAGAIDQDSGELGDGADDEPAASLEDFLFEDQLVNYDWIETNVVLLTTENDGLLLGEAGAQTTFGRIESRPFTVQALDGIVIDLFVSRLTPGASYTIQLQEDEGDYRAHDIFTGDSPTSLALDLVDVTGWKGEKTFRFVVWLSGEGAEMALDRLRLTTADLVESDTAEQLSVQPIWWEETFDPLTYVWQVQDIATALQDDGAMRLQVAGTNEAGPFGKYESEVIFANLDSYPILEIDISDVAPNSSYAIQIQEEGGLYRNFDGVIDTATAVHVIDLAQLTGWSADQSFRVLIWVTGESIAVQNVKLRSR